MRKGKNAPSPQFSMRDATKISQRWGFLEKQIDLAAAAISMRKDVSIDNIRESTVSSMFDFRGIFGTAMCPLIAIFSVDPEMTQAQRHD
jgi:hypothetical protein